MSVTGLTSYTQSLSYDGKGIGVAVIDSGIDNLADLSNGTVSRVVYRQNFVLNEDLQGDAYGHGDHVAGIIGGNGTKSTGTTPLGTQYQFTYKVRGLAPAVNLI